MQIKPQPKQAQAWIKLLDKTTKYVVFGGAAGGGKGLDLNQLVLSNNGWKKAKDITMEDKLVSVDGTYTNILGIFPQGMKERYKFTFEDGAESIVDDTHLWTVWNSKHSWRDGWKVKSTRQLVNEKGSHAIPLMTSPAPGTYVPEYDPYILGYIIGDGTLASDRPIIYTADIDTTQYLKERGWNIYKYRDNVYQCQLGFPNGAASVFKELGKMSKDNKRIPENILNGTPEVRIAFLQGLMDSDGTVDKDGTCSFSTMYQGLAEDMVYLVRSLGGKSSIETKKRLGGGNGNQKNSQNHEKDVRVSHCNRFMPFRLKRKVERVKVAKYDKRYIKSIERISDGETVCFKVDHPSSLFVIKDFVVTHNTWLGCEWLLSMCLTYPGSKWFIGRSELKRIMMSVVPSMRKVCVYHDLKFEEVMTINGQYNYIQFTNGSRIDLLDLKSTPTDPLFERFGSLEFSGGWIEEAGEVDNRAFEILKSRIGRHMSDEIKPKILITCNPKKNWLYYDFYLPNKEGRLPANCAFIEAKFSDNEFTRVVYGEQLADLKDMIQRQRLEHGVWEYDDDGSALLNFDEVLSVFVGEGEKTGTKYMTIDPAFLGKDMAVIMIWDGFVVTKTVVIPKTDHSTLIQLIDMLSRQEDVPKRNIVADAAGEGAYLPSVIPGIRGFLGGSSALQDKNAKYDELKRAFYANLRTQCIYEAAYHIKLGKLKVENYTDEVKKNIIAELQLWKVEEITDEKKLKIIGKDEMKDALGGKSTDYTDALYMRMFFELNGDKSGMRPEAARKQMLMNEQRQFNKWGV